MVGFCFKRIKYQADRFYLKVIRNVNVELKILNKKPNVRYII